MLIPLLVGLATAVAAAWLSLTIVVIAARPKGRDGAPVASFPPNVLRLLSRLYSDPAVPRSVRVRVWVAIAYNVQPFTIIPDFIPVIGLADNVAITAWALRSAVRRAGPEAVAGHWPGPADQLVLLFRLTRLGSPPQPGGRAA